MKWRKVEVGVTWDESTFETMEEFPRDPCSPKLRMGAWNLNTFRFRRWLYTPRKLIIWRSVSQESLGI